MQSNTEEVNSATTSALSVGVDLKEVQGDRMDGENDAVDFTNREPVEDGKDIKMKVLDAHDTITVSSDTEVEDAKQSAKELDSTEAEPLNFEKDRKEPELSQATLVEEENTCQDPPKTVPSEVKRSVSGKPTVNTNSLGLEITQELRDQAIEIQRACLLNDITIEDDWMLYRMAALVKGDIEKAVRRFKNINDIYCRLNLREIDPIVAFDVVQERMPESLYGFIGRDVEGRLVLTMRAQGFLPSKLKEDPYLERCVMRVMLSLFENSCTSPEDFDRGIIFAQAAKGMGYKNFSMKMEKDYAWTYQDGFPIRVKALVMIDANLIVRSVIKLFRAFLSKKLQDRIVIINNHTVLHKLIPASILPTGTDLGTKSMQAIRADFVAQLNASAKIKDTFSF